MSIINSQPLVGASGQSTGPYTLSKSLRFRSSASAYLSKSYSGGVGNTTTFTWSGWVKRGAIGSVTHHLFNGGTGVNTVFGFGQVNYDDLSGNLRGTGGTNYFFGTSAVFRDPSAWYHITLAVDTTQATSSNRIKLYVNGVLQTLSTANYPPQNQVLLDTGTRYIGSTGSTYYLDGYLADTYFIDGTQKAAIDFGEIDSLTGVWKPKAYSGTYGTNGFYLKFTNTTSTATLGNDSSGNSNTWTVNNISLTAGSTYDSMNDVPTLTSATVANYSVLNPLSSGITITDGNLTYASLGSGNGTSAFGSMLMSSGKWYWETTLKVYNGATTYIGIINNSFQEFSPSTSANWTTETIAYRNNATLWINNTSTTSYGATYTAGDVIGVALDITGGTLTFYKNNVSQGVATSTGISGNSWYALLSSNNNASDTFAINFGQQPFVYTPPTGYVALNTYNLSTPTIAAGNKYMDATTYTGNGSTQSITNTGAFKPDFVWIKNRGAVASHRLTDSVRGVTKEIYSDQTAAEATDTNGLTAFNSNGFTVGSTGAYNQNGTAIVGWQWQAGQGSTSSNTSGSITSNVSVSTTGGFSIVTFNNATSGTYTVGHGLGVAPQFILIKYRAITSNWFCYHASLGYTQRVFLNTTAAASTVAYWTSAPTSTTVNFDTSFADNPSQSLVMYCWAPIAGFSQFGSYTGNGSTDGTFTYTGFRPKFVLIKRTDSTSDWYVWDTARDTYNVVTNTLLADTSAAETSATSIDIISNGFKCKSATIVNASGGTYIYMAFAENPFKYSNAR
jgi:hypothetical protein